MYSRRGSVLGLDEHIGLHAGADAVGAEAGELAGRNLVDIGRVDPGLKLEAVLGRHDQRGQLGRSDDAADPMHGELVYEADAGAANLNPLHRIFRRDPTLDQLGALALDLARLRHPNAQFMIELLKMPE